MTLWLILILMTAAALAGIIWPFAFSGAMASSGSEVAVYKDQLLEIDRDREAGLIGGADAEAARIEVSRRLLKATEPSNADRPPVAGRNGRMRRLAVLATALVIVPTLAGGTYLRLGSPNTASVERIADQVPSRSDDASIDIDAMVAQVEENLRDNPNDGQGWEALAPAYMHLGRYGDAVRAWRNAIANLGDSVDREENLGESLVAAADGAVTREARAAFAQALAIDSGSVDARFYTGLAAKQDGRRDEAARIWRDLIAAAPPDADWIDTVRDALARIDEPSMAATDNAPPSGEQQASMIKSMVEGLSERLKTDRGDLDGWLRLVRSYNVLGESDKAKAAVANARTALASDPDKLARFENGLKSADRPQESISREDPGQPVSTVAAPPEHDNAKMQSMVDKLAERLKSKGGDVASWLMLVRSYEALGERDKALATVAQARLAFASDRDNLSRFEQLLGATDSASNAASTPETVQKPKSEKPTLDATLTEQQLAMIKGMVDGLAERLKQDGRDVDGWIRLMRSYLVLGQPDKASAAGQGARVALGSDAEALRRLKAGAKELGVELP
jgi:cytochrome c-type biogenesis protein CcmH